MPAPRQFLAQMRYQALGMALNGVDAKRGNPVEGMVELRDHRMRARANGEGPASIGGEVEIRNSIAGGIERVDMGGKVRNAIIAPIAIFGMNWVLSSKLLKIKYIRGITPPSPNPIII